MEKYCVFCKGYPGYFLIGRINFEYFLFQLMPKAKKSFLHDWTDVGGVGSPIVRENNTGR